MATPIEINPKLAGTWPRDKIGRFCKTITMLINTGSIEENIDLNCEIFEFHFTIPDLDGAETAELILHDDQDRTRYSSGELAESTTHMLSVEDSTHTTTQQSSIPICGTTTIRIEAESSQAAARVFEVVGYYRI